MQVATEMWVGFGVVFLAMMAVDMLSFSKKAHDVTIKESVIWSIIWTLVAVAFNVWVYYAMGSKSGSEFLTAYIIERSLSVDNLFVFVLIFSYFAVPHQHIQRALFWGIMMAVVMRVALLFAGVALLNALHFVVYIFGAFLVYTAYKIITQKEMEVAPEKNVVVKLAQRFIRTTGAYDAEGRFFVKKDGRRYATLMFFVLLVIATTDLIFAVDSIPAVLAISEDAFIAVTSNVFAVMGLRALYFVLGAAVSGLYYLKHGLAAILSFVGLKMLGNDLYHHFTHEHFPTTISLGVVVLILAVAIIASLRRTSKMKGQVAEEHTKLTPH